MNNNIKKKVFSILGSIAEIFRFLLGPRGVCIYPVSCRTYARMMLQEKPLYKALLFITWQVLCCNPVNSWWQYKK